LKLVQRRPPMIQHHLDCKTILRRRTLEEEKNLQVSALKK
jgi:hypothetical protein